MYKVGANNLSTSCNQNKDHAPSQLWSVDQIKDASENYTLMPFKSVGHQVFITRAQLPAKNYHIEFNFGLASQHWGRFIDHLEPYISVGRRELFPKAHERLVHGRNSARFYPVKLFDMQSPCMSEFSIPFTVKFALANLFFGDWGASSW